MSAPNPTALAGESATLEERLREYADSKTMLEDVPGEPDGIEICGWCGQTWPEHDPAGCIAQTVADALAELARLTADVERLTAERDGAREAVEHACWLMREPMTLVEAEEARTYLTGMVVMQKKRARRALT